MTLSLPTVFDRACDISDEYGAAIDPVVRSGDTLGEIVEYVAEHDIDHVVIGEHPRTNLRPLLRDVPEAVTRSVSEPVNGGLLTGILAVRRREPYEKLALYGSNWGDRLR